MDDVVTTPTTASTPAPATPTPAETPAVTPPERPTSMRDAFEQVQAKHSATPGTPTTQAAETPTTDGKPAATKGPIPFDVHETSMKNAREKTRADVEAEYRQKYGWADTLDRSAAESGVQIARMFAQDREGFVRQMLHDAVADPTLAPVVRSEAARILNGARGQTSPEIDLEPDNPALYDNEGRQLTQAGYSAQKVQALVQKAVQDALAKEVAPLKQAHDTRVQQEALTQLQSTATADATAAMTEASKWSGFAEHKGEIANVFRANPTWSLERAYLDVLHRVILPSRDRTSQAQTMASLKDKAVAQVETTTTTAASPGKKLRTPQDLARFMESRVRR